MTAIAIEDLFDRNEPLALLRTLDRSSPKTKLESTTLSVIVTCCGMLRLPNPKVPKAAVLFGYTQKEHEPVRFYVIHRREYLPIEDALSALPAAAVLTVPGIVSLHAHVVMPMPNMPANHGAGRIAMGLLPAQESVMELLGLDALLK